MDKGFIKMKKYRINFEMTFDIEVYAPEDTDGAVVLQHAQDIAQSPGIHGWDFPEAYVHCEQEDVDIDPSECVMAGRSPGPGVFSREETYVLSKEHEFVCPGDDRWWVRAAETPAEGEKAKVDPRQGRLPFLQPGKEQ